MPVDTKANNVLLEGRQTRNAKLKFRTIPTLHCSSHQNIFFFDFSVSGGQNTAYWIGPFKNHMT